jgi:septal ring factor EnvC (AmiA/AmiB activator)
MDFITPPVARRVLPAAIGLVVLTAGAGAQTVEDLSTIERQLDASTSRQSEMKAARETIAREAEALSQKLIAVAESIQSREAAIMAAEERLKSLESEELGLKSDLAMRREEISKLLAGLQRIERNPPPALVVEPKDVLSALRGAMLFGSVVPDLNADASALKSKLVRLETIRLATAAEQGRLKDYLARLESSRAEMTELQARKATLLAETEEQLKAERARARALAAKARDLRELLASLEEERRRAEEEEKARAIAEAKALAEAEEKARAAAEAEAKARAEAQAKAIAEAEAREKAKAEAEEEERVRAHAEAEAKAKAAAEAEIKAKEAAEAHEKAIAEAKAKAEAEEARKLAQSMRPKIAFAKTQGRLQYPVQGQILKTYGMNDGFGGKTRGVFVATRPDAQIVTPADGHVEFAGSFRSYGQLLILNAGGGYHVLLAGLGEISAAPGQFVKAGEPVGIMGQNAAPGTLTGDQVQDGRPVLYIEFRKNGEAIDSAPWWVGGFAQARG